MCKLGDGSTVLFWDDLWSSNVVADLFPRLFSFASNTQVSVRDVINAEDLETLFSLPLSQEAFSELQQLQLYLQDVPYNASMGDQWSFIWSNATYTSSRLYKRVFSGWQAQPAFTWLWQSKCTPD